MILEEQRFLHEDLERLENGIADRVLEEPRLARDRLNRDHQIAGFLDRLEDQSKRLLEIYEDAGEARAQEIQTIGTGETLEEFYRQLAEIKAFHQKYPNEPVENLERAYKKPPPGENTGLEIDNMFTGEEACGRFFDLTSLHEQYLNLPSIKRLSYLQYLDNFDVFAPPLCPIKRVEKTTDQYFKYVGELAEYLEGFMRRTRPLENLDKLLESFDAEFEKAWTSDDIPGWKMDVLSSSSAGGLGAVEAQWCLDCEKEFKNENVYKGHLGGKKHKRAAEARAVRQVSGSEGATDKAKAGSNMLRLKERAVAEREYRVKRLAAAMSEQRSDSRTNVERRQGMTERERQQELDALFAETTVSSEKAKDAESDSDDDDEKIYNPLKLPLAWDGKPIPFWLYKLHGLGVEFPCEICGNFVYMGRRAFDKHFNESRHIYGLKCLGITNTTLFREITNIEDALKLWDKIQREKRMQGSNEGGVVQMEDGEGNVMPEKVYYDLQKQGLL